MISSTTSRSTDSLYPDEMNEWDMPDWDRESIAPDASAGAEGYPGCSAYVAILTERDVNKHRWGEFWVDQDRSRHQARTSMVPGDSELELGPRC